MWEVGREEAFRDMVANPSTKIMHDEFELYVRKLIASPAAPK